MPVAGLRFRRKHSRIRLFRRLRSTARLETLRETTTASRANPSELGRAWEAKYWPRSTWPVRNTFRTLASSLIRDDLGKSFWIIPPRLDGEPGAAFSASGVQHLASAFGFHAGAEAMGFLAFFDAGLECAFHGQEIRIAGRRGRKLLPEVVKVK